MADLGKRNNSRKRKFKSCAVVIPVFNEASNIPLIFKAIKKIFTELPKFNLTIVFINDGSGDDSWREILTLAKREKNVIGINFSRNFGKEKALTAGLEYASNFDAVITMDSDLQHPPEKIPEMIALWESGAETVIGLRGATTNESFFRKLGSRLFHKIMRSISDLDSQAKSTDFRLYNQDVVKAINTLGEKDRLFRGLADWVGFNRATIVFDADERRFGASTFSLGSLINLAFTSFVSFSLWPLKIIVFFGFSILILSISILLIMIIDSLFFGYLSASPLAYGLISVLAALGLIIIILGVISLYLGKVSQEVLNRPNFIIKEVIGIRNDN